MLCSDAGLPLLPPPGPHAGRYTICQAFLPHRFFYLFLSHTRLSLSFTCRLSLSSETCIRCFFHCRLFLVLFLSFSFVHLPSFIIFRDLYLLFLSLPSLSCSFSIFLFPSLPDISLSFPVVPFSFFLHNRIFIFLSLPYISLSCTS